MPEDETRRIRFRNNYVLILTLAISIVFIAMIRPFLEALLLAGIGAAILHPVYRWLRKRFKGRETVASIVTILIVLGIIVGPLTAFLGIGQSHNSPLSLPSPPSSHQA